MQNLEIRTSDQQLRLHLEDSGEELRIVIGMSTAFVYKNQDREKIINFFTTIPASVSAEKFRSGAVLHATTFKSDIGITFVRGSLPIAHLTLSNEQVLTLAAIIKTEHGRKLWNVDALISRKIIESSSEVVNDLVNKPAHYTDGKIETIDYIEDKQLGFNLGNAVKYISRAGKKDPSKTKEDLQKALWYLQRQINKL